MFAPFDLSRIIQIVFPFFPMRPPTQCFRISRPSSTNFGCSKLDFDGAKNEEKLLDVCAPLPVCCE